MDFSVGLVLWTQDFRLGYAKVERLPRRAPLNLIGREEGT